MSRSDRARLTGRLLGLAFAVAVVFLATLLALPADRAQPWRVLAFAGTVVLSVAMLTAYSRGVRRPPTVLPPPLGTSPGPLPAHRARLARLEAAVDAALTGAGGRTAREPVRQLLARSARRYAEARGVDYDREPRAVAQLLGPHLAAVLAESPEGAAALSPDALDALIEALEDR